MDRLVLLLRKAGYTFDELDNMAGKFPCIVDTFMGIPFQIIQGDARYAVDYVLE